MRYLSPSLLLGIFLFSTNAFAGSIIINIEGVFDQPDVIFPSVQSGDPWSARMVMDLSTPDANEKDWVGAYGPAVTFSFSFDGFSMTGPATNSGVTIFNNDPLTIDGFDSLFVFFSSDLPLPVHDGIAIQWFLVNLNDETELVFQNQNLSEIVGATLSDFGSDFDYLLLNPSRSILGQVTSLSITAVPIQPAIYLFSSALVLLGWMHRRVS